ncbi:hypothetical protein [Microbacterium aerolatum]|nr:hypothetical protein [Microbacterium aerolatum]
MLLNRVLDPTDDERVRSDIAALAEPRTLQVDGVSQDRQGVHQFRFWVNEPAAAWGMVLESGARWSYSEGVVDYGHGEPRPIDFIASLPSQLRMLWPTEFLIWGDRPTHFRPVLLQSIGQRSLLLTFEHGKDPAMRQTMVIDRTTGIATKRIEYDHGIILTNIAALDAPTPTLDTIFEPVTDWIRAKY